MIVAVALVGLKAASHASQDRALALREAWPVGEERMLVPSPQAARVAAAGYNELAADLAWIRTLVYYGDRLMKGKSLVEVEELLRLVNALDPQFRRPYQWGAYATLMRQPEGGGRWIMGESDVVASIEVLERGVKAFPQDWELAWILGIRYYMDKKSDDPEQRRRDRETGAEWIERAMRLPGAPADLPLLAASLRTKLGQTNLALQQLREMILSTEDPAARAKLKERYARLASSEEAADALEAAARDFIDSWRDEMPYAPPSLFVLVGPRPAPAIALERLAAGPTFEVEDELDDNGGGWNGTESDGTAAPGP